MKKVLWWLAMNGGFATAVWFGFIVGIEGAQHLVKFWIWAVSIPFAFIALTDAMQKKMAAEPENSFRRATSHTIAWFALGVLVWYGHIATALAWGFWMLAGAIAREGAKRHREGATAAPAA